MSLKSNTSLNIHCRGEIAITLMTQYKRLKRHFQQCKKNCGGEGGDFQGLGSQEVKFRFKGMNSTDDSVFWFLLGCFSMF